MESLCKELYRYIDRELYKMNKEILCQIVKSSLDKIIYLSTSQILNDRRFQIQLPKDVKWIYVPHWQFPNDELLFQIMLERYFRDTVRDMLCRRKYYPTNVEFRDGAVWFQLDGFISRMLAYC